MFCTNCGASISDKAVVCVSCGVATQNMPGTAAPQAPVTNAVGYDWLTTLLLCFFLGGLGVHNFYTKKTGVAIFQLLTLGGCGIWALVDFIMILTESYVDGFGRPLVRR
ncbi:MAG TPA: TM2 domain-containing protein [Puia sp.]|nr:TM2 domain-containing protein [Puia sp.]